MFYTYNQNSSGGSFEIDDNLDQYVIIEADSAEEANDKAEDLGIYFDGVEKEIDCPCCGNRWHECYEKDGEEKPLVWGRSPKEFLCSEYTFGKPKVIVHYKNGNKVVHEIKKED